ncbi:hypothetical protein AVEN_199327-1 [Araneus ventricosus]|uniref:Uncharacterized protein n=1 Tax=Araneus ventricosus TaxID=182803 RepID=A0A4Y2RJY8_ARAVE|nr:hypothetical protein AVEN_93738-1 [Araneus ventricosus]GBN75958.1 hypothetical protein AVEN_199327-1 [Araneus ventricosus]
MDYVPPRGFRKEFDSHPKTAQNLMLFLRLDLKEELGLRWPSWTASTFGVGGFQARNSIPLKIHRICGLLHAKSYSVAQHPPADVVQKFGEGVTVQVPFSSSDSDSKL